MLTSDQQENAFGAFSIYVNGMKILVTKMSELVSLIENKRITEERLTTEVSIEETLTYIKKFHEISVGNLNDLLEKLVTKLIYSDKEIKPEIKTEILTQLSIKASPNSPFDASQWDYLENVEKPKLEITYSEQISNSQNVEELATLESTPNSQETSIHEVLTQFEDTDSQPIPSNQELIRDTQSWGKVSENDLPTNSEENKTEGEVALENNEFDNMLDNRSEEIDVASKLVVSTEENNADEQIKKVVCEINQGLEEMDQSPETQDENIDPDFLKALNLIDKNDVNEPSTSEDPKITKNIDSIDSADILDSENVRAIEATLFEDDSDDKKDDQNVDSDEFINDIDTSDEETKLNYRKAMKNILYGSLSSLSSSSSTVGENEDMDLDSSFDGRKTVELKVDEELDKILTPKKCIVQLEKLPSDESSKEAIESPSKKRRLVFKSSHSDSNSSEDEGESRRISPRRKKLKRKSSNSESSHDESEKSKNLVRKMRSSSSSSVSSSDLSSLPDSNLPDNKSSSDSESEWSPNIDTESNSDDNKSVAGSVSSDSSSGSDSSVIRKKKKVVKKLNLSNIDSDEELIKDVSSESEGKRTPRKSDWRNDPLLRINIHTPAKKTPAKKVKDEVTKEVPLPSDDDSDFAIIGEEKGTKKPFSKYKQTKLNFLKFDISSESDDDVVRLSTEEDTPTKMKNIRKVISFEDLAEATKKANALEKERLARLTQLQNSYDEMQSQNEDAEKCLVLEYDEKKNKPRIKVSEDLTQKLKDYQKTGVKFMWDSCFETAKLARETSGSGCVVAHCMGLGKTLQVITLIDTLFNYQPLIKMKRILVLAPPSTIQNWADEFKKWIPKPKFQIYTLLDCTVQKQRTNRLKMWQSTGGVMIMNYILFRVMLQEDKKTESEPIKSSPAKVKKLLSEMLINPGPQFLICDEGHTLKNSKSQLSKVISKIKTKRRIMMTGTPMQNNLKEYYCMINLVKPNLLGSEAEFANQFINPITAGQTRDSSAGDINRMKRRSHVLHKKLSGVVQRMEGSILRTYLPHLTHFVIFVKLSEPQQNIYKEFLKWILDRDNLQTRRLLANYHIAKRISTHPKCLTLLKNIKDPKKTKNNKILEDADLENEFDHEELIQLTQQFIQNKLWQSLYTEEQLNDIQFGSKIIVFFNILTQCCAGGDKVIVFTTSLHILDVVEYYLNQCPIKDICNLTWRDQLDYIRVDGSVPKQKRQDIYNKFNDKTNRRLKLLMTSTKVSGLGVNLIGANRIIILDTPWNPADDMQCVYRIYRLGQTKQCYIYSLIGLGTMEERIYERSVTKQAVSCRVIDEQQIDRHYTSSSSVIKEFYTFRDYEELDIPAINVPSDRILANTLQKLPDLIWKYHEHDKLLQNQEEEELNETEREAAWAEFQLEEQRRNEPPTPPPYSQFTRVPQNFIRVVPEHMYQGVRPPNIRGPNLRGALPRAVPRPQSSPHLVGLNPFGDSAPNLRPSTSSSTFILPDRVDSAGEIIGLGEQEDQSKRNDCVFVIED